MWYTSFHHEVENGNLILFLFLYYKKRDKEFKFICFLLSIATTLTALIYFLKNATNITKSLIYICINMTTHASVKLVKSYSKWE